MAVETRELRFETDGEVQLIDITGMVARELGDSGITSGIVNIHVPGATGAISTIEYEPGLIKDFPDALERLVPKDLVYEHHIRWKDGNGHSHVRASMLGPSLTVPFNDGQMILGKWQQIIFCELDVRPRERRIVLQIVGE